MSKKPKTQESPTMLTMDAKRTVWKTEHKDRPPPTIQGRHWYSAGYVLPIQCYALLAIVINGEVVYSLEEHGRRSSGVLSSGGTWKLQRRFIAGECVCLSLEIQNTLIRKIRKKATKVAVIVEGL